MTCRQYAPRGLPCLVVLLTVLVGPARPAWANDHDDAWTRLRDYLIDLVEETRRRLAVRNPA